VSPQAQDKRDLFFASATNERHQPREGNDPLCRFAWRVAGHVCTSQSGCESERHALLAEVGG
jgi:hypothetical protein